MKINNKGYASTIIMFSILTLFLISMLMLVKTMNNSSTLNKQITEKVVDNIDYDASGTVQDQILELKTTITSMQNQIDNIKGEVINEIYPVGSIYMSTTDDTKEKVQEKFGGTWEKYAQGRTLIGEGTGTDSNGLVQTFTNNSTGGEYTHKLAISEMPNHSHSIPSLSVSSWSGSHKHSNNDQPLRYYGNGDVVNFGSNGTLNGWDVQPAPSNNTGYGRLIIVGWNTNDTMITVSGQKTTVSNTGAQGSNNSFNVENPYIVTYMYKRIN